jgi:hypothetical protein
MAFLGLPCSLLAQDAGAIARATDSVPSAAIPDAPTPQIDLAAVDLESAQSQNAQQTDAGSAPLTGSSAAPSQNSSSQSSSSTQQSSAGSQQSSSNTSPSTTQPADAQETQQQKAAEQIKEQEHQRVAGIIPTFNVSYRSDAVSMTPSQKISLAFHSATDPFTFAAGFLVAGLHEGLDDDPGFPWGPKGYFERAGAAYLDAFDGTMIGNGLLPSLLRQDPRYFRLGHGSTTHRLLYALASNFMCKGDRTRKWQPNYSNVGGNIIAGALSNLYYPQASRSGVGLTFKNGIIVTAEGGAGSLFNEFWPDISRKFLHKDPTHGLDAQAAAADKSKKKNKVGASGNAAAPQ